MTDHIKALFEGQELSEEFKAKATTILEAAVADKESQIRESVEAELQEVFESKTADKVKELEELAEAYVQENYLDQIDKYLTIAAKEWLDENQIALEEGAKVELADSFLKGLVGLAESHNLEIPQGEYDKVKSLEESIDKLKTSVVSLKESNHALAEEAKVMKKEKIVEGIVADLSEAQKEKFAAVVSKVEFKTEEQFSEAVKSLYESYHPTTPDTKVPVEEPAKTITENVDPYMENLKKGLL